MMVTVNIDGHIVHVEHQTPVLEVARSLGINIPTLCNHKAVQPYGACRLCMVEAVIKGRSKLVTSCNFPSEEGLTVRTDSLLVKITRRSVVELLLARCPDVPLVQQLAEEMGVGKPKFKKTGEDRCVLCGLCVRACEQIVGVSALCFTNRGIEREVNTPFAVKSETCIGCGTCTYICPTGCIEMVGEPGPPEGRQINMGDLNLDLCPNDHNCETCERDSQFMKEMKSVMDDIRLTS